MKKPDLRLLTARGVVGAAAETAVTTNGEVHITLIDKHRQLMGVNAILIEPDDAVRLATDLLNAARLAKAEAEVNVAMREAFKP